MIQSGRGNMIRDVVHQARAVNNGAYSGGKTSVHVLYCKNKSLAILLFLATNFILFFISACFPSAERIEQNIAKLKKADAQHQQMLTQELDANSDNAAIVPETKPQSLVTLEEGDDSPSWVKELPLECESQVYCGLAFVDHCENANSCREEAETKARNNLRKQISVKLRSITSSRTYTELSAENADGHKTFQSEIRERAANIELKNVSFTHFYLRPEKQLQTLARMERPEETETKTETAEIIVPGALPPLLLAFTDNGKTPNLNRKETKSLFQQRYIEALRSENAVFLAGGIFQDWQALHGNALRERASTALAEHPGSVVLILSLSGRLDPYEGKMFKGLATVFLNVAAYGKEGVPLFRKSFQVRRFMVEAQDSLEDDRRQSQFLRTVEKGLNEFEGTLIEELKLALSQK